MLIRINIEPKDIADLMVTAIEGNHMVRAWCASIKPTGRTVAFAEALEAQHKSRWYAIPDFYKGGFELMVEEISDESTGEITKHRINAGSFKAGMQRMAETHASHFGDFRAENYDIYTADIFLQLVVLKEVVYG